MKILITGGNGFIAKNLKEGLDQQYKITSLSKKQLDLLEPNKVSSYLANNRFDVIIHTATYDAAAKGSTKDPVKVLESNLRMFFSFVRCKKNFKKMIYFGSGAEFSRKHWIPKMKENYYDCYMPIDQYGFSKYLMTKYALQNNNIYNLRLFGVFGKYDDWKTRVIPNLCDLALMGLPLTIEQNKYYDFLYVNDLVRIVKWFVGHKPRWKVYNVCSGKTVSFKTLGEKIIKIAGKKLTGKKLKLRIEKNGLGQEYSGDNCRLLRELKGFEFTPIDKSLKDLYDWFKQNEASFKHA